ncbi:Mobile element protein [Candidatus Enterovibrio escicola]|uniref:Mobile element protein n=1 Tax=Candidatus Enterovibrio escicola TaxID=1927127 RepID=A0A2A5T4A3_9GAMM|nr:Mobile element protein [Candidatus Enterovibrio escacola]
MKNYYLHKDLGMNNLDVVSVDIDGFCQTFLPAWEKHLISSDIK